MCGRFTLASDRSALEEIFPGVEFPEPLSPRYNIAPSQLIAAVCNTGSNMVELLQWGLIPHWAKDPKVGHKMINARAESLAQKPSFSEPFRKKRCLVLADGFYEWKKEPGGKAKTPMYIRLRSGLPFAFAGLWDVWRSQGEEIHSCTIITTDSNELVAGIHDRMPVILSPADYAEWLDARERKPETLQGMLKPYPSEELEAFEVAAKVNDPKFESPECVLPV